MRFGRSLENLLTNIDPELLDQSYFMNGYGMLVADGMGGMAGGEVASRLALTKLIDLIVETSDWTLALKRQRDVTTLTVAGAIGNDLIIGHVGDSRAYLLRGDSFKQLTTDHTLAQALIDAGVASRDDPASRSMRHVLTAAVGSLGDQVDPQVQRLKLSAGDQLLLCTDGLTEIVDDEIIAQVMRESTSAQSTCQALVDLALASGGPDNITIVLAHFISLDIRE
jgi:protein phosphatase